MKVSLNLIRFINEHYSCGVDPYSYGVDEILRRIGAQLGAVEDVEYFGKKYEGIVVAKVVECVPHDNSDHLSVCTIDAGGVNSELATEDPGLIQVVCGAPNVRAGLTVAWIPPGAVVPSTSDKDPFVLSVREIRGKVSNGMLASPAELGLSDNHDGILEIDVNDVGEELARPGTEFKNLYGLDDVIIDCENKMFTHRPDCFGTLGVAREIAGIFGDPFTSPEWYKEPLVNEVTASLAMSVENQVPDLVSRFMMQAVADVTIGQSPMWLQAYLARVDMKSINNIVDYSNYFMMLTAQPTHAFDYDKVVALCGVNPVFSPRLAKAGEKIALLNGKEIALNDQDMVITANNKPIALAGVMGGSETEVDENTKNIVIECATFDMYAVRRSSMRHGLFTDAVTRYTKGQSPLQNDRVLAKIVDEIVKFADGKVASEVFDTSDELPPNQAVRINTNMVAKILGDKNIDSKTIQTLLTNVGFGVQLGDGDDECWITAPFWRMDIEIPEDIVEEVGRLYGYDKLPIVLPPRISKPTRRNAQRDFENSLRNKLSNYGGNEVLTYSFVHGDLMRDTGSQPDKWAYHLRNAISPELQYYRTSLMPSLLSKVHANIKSQAGDENNEFLIFEVGRAHLRGENESKEDLPKELRHIAGVFAVSGKATANHSDAYYEAKKYVDLLTNSKATYLPLEISDYPIATPYQIGRSAAVYIDDVLLGVVGEYSTKTRLKLKLPELCSGFELDTERLKDLIGHQDYQPLSQFPNSVQDLTLEIKDSTSWFHVEKVIKSELAVAKAEQGYWYHLTPIDIFKSENSNKKRLTFRLDIAHHHKTLKTEEVNKLLDGIADAAKESLGAERI